MEVCNKGGERKKAEQKSEGKKKERDKQLRCVTLLSCHYRAYLHRFRAITSLTLLESHYPPALALIRELSI